MLQKEKAIADWIRKHQNGTEKHHAKNVSIKILSMTTNEV